MSPQQQQQQLKICFVEESVKMALFSIIHSHHSSELQNWIIFDKKKDNCAYIPESFS